MGLNCPAELIPASNISKPKCPSSRVLLQTGLPMCFLTKQSPEANKPPTCPSLVWSLTGSFRNHTVSYSQPCHSPSQAWCRHGPSDHQPPALSQIRVEESLLPTTRRRCFVRVIYCGERDFPEDGKAALISGHLCAKSPLHPSPEWLHTLSTHNSAQGTARSLLPGVQLGWALCFKEPPKRARLRLFWNLGLRAAVLGKQAGLPSVNRVLSCCEHTGSALCWRTRSCFTHLGLGSRKSALQ